MLKYDHNVKKTAKIFYRIMHQHDEIHLPKTRVNNVDTFRDETSNDLKKRKTVRNSF